MTSFTKPRAGERNTAHLPTQARRAWDPTRKCGSTVMKLESKRSAGLKGALALLFIALAGGAAFALARRDGGPSKAGEAQAAISSETVGPAKMARAGEDKVAALTCEKAPEKPSEKPA